MNSRKSISRVILAFAAAAACFSSQLTALAASDASAESAAVPAVIDQNSFKMTIPTVYLHLDGGAEELDKVNASQDHSYEATGSLDIVVPEGFEGYAGSDAVITGLNGAKMEYFRGRGNSTWEADNGKKPYKIKLEKKADIFGLGKSKHWALLANAMDTTLSRNRYSAYMSEGMGFEFTPSGYPVDVMLDDGKGGCTYLGSYYLCENVRLESGRMELDPPAEGETSEGDYLLAHQQGFVGKNIFHTDHKVDLMNDDPSFDPADGGTGTEAQREYIRSYVQDAENAVILGRVRDETAPDGWREVSAEDYIDYETAAKYWLIEDFSMNRDAFKGGSAYFYKTADTAAGKGKLFFGPVWDMDLAYCMGNQKGIYVNHAWTNSLLKDKKFAEAVVNENRELNRKISDFKDQMAAAAAKDMFAGIKHIGDVSVIAAIVTSDVAEMKAMADSIKAEYPTSVAVLASNNEGKITFVAMATKDAVAKGVHCGNIIKEITAVCGGRGGGKPDMAQGGGTLTDKLSDALVKAEEILKAQINK